MLLHIQGSLLSLEVGGSKFLRNVYVFTEINALTSRKTRNITNTTVSTSSLTKKYA